MVVLRHFAHDESVKFLSRLLPEDKSLAYIGGNATAKVRQAESFLTVAAVGRAEERKERLVLTDRQRLTVAESPAFGREVETHDPDFGKEWFSHGWSEGG